MENKYASVKNPLTVIAIFSGITEISGAAVLPHIASENQTLYIWFLMLFPFALIGLFFITLNYNHRVLYAPSDFKDEDNFVNILKKSTIGEVIEYKQREVIAIVPDESLEEPPPLPDQNMNQPETLDKEEPPTTTADSSTTENWLEKAESTLLGINGVTTRMQRNQLDLISRQISERRMRDSRLAEKLALEALEDELEVSIDREMKLEIDNGIFHFDGIARRGQSLTAIEVKYFRSRRTAPVSMMMWQELHRNLERLYRSLKEEQRRDFSFILVLISDNDSDEIERRAAKRLEDLPFPVGIKTYDFDTLVAERGGPGLTRL